MDSSFWGYGLLAILIAVALSSVELLTKYQSRSLSEIFGTVYYLLFALLNAFFCFLVYLVLPWLSGSLLSTGLPIDLDEGPGRALAAGLGYLVIARISVLDIKTKSGETYGAGFDAIYSALAQYLMRQHNFKLRRHLYRRFSSLFDQASFEAFLEASRLHGANVESAEKAAYEERLTLALTLNEDRQTEKALLLYQLLLEHMSSEGVAELVLEQQKKLPPNPARPEAGGGETEGAGR